MPRFLAVRALRINRRNDSMIIDKILCPPNLTNEDAKAITRLLEGAGLMLGIGVPVDYEIIITEDSKLSVQEQLRSTTTPQTSPDEDYRYH